MAVERPPLPHVEDGLVALVRRGFGAAVGRAPTRAELLTTVAHLQSDPERARALRALLGSGDPVEAGALLAPAGATSWR